MKIKIGIIVIGMFVVNLMSAERDAQWEAVENAQANDQPQTVVQLLKPIEQVAIADKAWGEAGKAMVMRWMAEGERQDDETATLLLINQELPNAPAQLQPILRLLSAEWLYLYYQSHQWDYTAVHQDL